MMTISSCRTVKQNDTSYIAHHDTVYVDKIVKELKHDSVFIHNHDSIYVNSYIDNGVQHVDKEKYIYVTKYKYKTDTIYSKKDSIVTARDTVYVNRIQTINKNESHISRLENVLKTLLCIAVLLLIILKIGPVSRFISTLFVKISRFLSHFLRH